MNANAFPLLSIFEPKLRLEVPLFQRQYVWTKDQQWEPLWEDISRKFVDYLAGRIETPVHFLGAMVLDQKLTPVAHVARRQVIDGQQRLTTFQLFLAAYGDFCGDQGYEDLANECRKYTRNTGMMSNPEVDRFKVWPTALDRPQFVSVITSGSRDEVERKHPLVRRKYSRKPDPRPGMVEAYLFFYDQISAFFIDGEHQLQLDDSVDMAMQLEECFNALRGSLQVVVIDLDEKDDPQVIFETLNARGQPLLPADLLRNYIFLRAGRAGENQEVLYEKHWAGFDEEFWREEVRQGRLNRPRSDLFMQHFLASRLTSDISAKHLYVEYRHWIEKREPFSSIEEELATLARQREDFRRIIAPERADPFYPASGFFRTFEVSTVYPLLLSALDAGLSDESVVTIAQHLESYIVRRAVCGMTTKNYNRTFLNLSRIIRSSDQPVEAIVEQLAAGAGDSTEWPSDQQFRTSWRTYDVYLFMSAVRIGYILRKLNDSLWTTMNEEIRLSTQLSIEHIMPQSWTENWLLADGSRGLSWQEMQEIDPEDLRAEATDRRNAWVHTLGNLTLLTQPLNSSNSNSEWMVKRDAIQHHSLLPINSMLQDEDRWDEDAIQRRSTKLFGYALQIWPRI